MVQSRKYINMRLLHLMYTGGVCSCESLATCIVLWISCLNSHCMNTLDLGSLQVACILKTSPVTADQYAVQSLFLKLLDNFYCSYNYNIYSFFGVITDAHSSSTGIFQNHLNINLNSFLLFILLFLAAIVADFLREVQRNATSLRPLLTFPLKNKGSPCMLHCSFVINYGVTCANLLYSF